MKNKEESNPTIYKDYFGNSVEIKESVNRIVSLTPNITELLYSLELGDKLVGRTDYCDYPEKVKDVQSIGTITEPSLEKIIELDEKSKIGEMNIRIGMDTIVALI